MRCRVNGQDVEPKQLARRPMNFMQTFPSAEPALCYEMVVPTVEFVANLRDAYQQAVQEEIADAPYHQNGEWPLLDRLQDLGYPPLEQLIVKQPELLADLVREWLDQETLDRLISGSGKEMPEYIVNSVDCVGVDQYWVRIQGQAYRHPAPEPQFRSIETMRIDSTTGPGNLPKAGSGTRRYMVTFTLTKDGKAERRQRAWRAPTKSAAMARVQRYYQNEGFMCTQLEATEIPNSLKP